MSTTHEPCRRGSRAGQGYASRERRDHSVMGNRARAITLDSYQTQVDGLKNERTRESPQPQRWSPRWLLYLPRALSSASPNGRPVRIQEPLRRCRRGSSRRRIPQQAVESQYSLQRSCCLHMVGRYNEHCGSSLLRPTTGDQPGAPPRRWSPQRRLRFSSPHPICRGIRRRPAPASQNPKRSR